MNFILMGDQPGNVVRQKFFVRFFIIFVFSSNTLAVSGTSLDPVTTDEAPDSATSELDVPPLSFDRSAVPDETAEDLPRIRDPETLSQISKLALESANAAQNQLGEQEAERIISAQDLVSSTDSFPGDDSTGGRSTPNIRVQVIPLNEEEVVDRAVQELFWTHTILPPALISLGSTNEIQYLKDRGMSIKTNREHLQSFLNFMNARSPWKKRIKYAIIKFSIGAFGVSSALFSVHEDFWKSIAVGIGLGMTLAQIGFFYKELVILLGKARITPRFEKWIPSLKENKLWNVGAKPGIDVAESFGMQTGLEGLTTSPTAELFVAAAHLHSAQWNFGDGSAAFMESNFSSSLRATSAQFGWDGGNSHLTTEANESAEKQIPMKGQDWYDQRSQRNLDISFKGQVAGSTTIEILRTLFQKGWTPAGTLLTNVGVTGAIFFVSAKLIGRLYCTLAYEKEVLGTWGAAYRSLSGKQKVIVKSAFEEFRKRVLELHDRTLNNVEDIRNRYEGTATTDARGPMGLIDFINEAIETSLQKATTKKAALDQKEMERVAREERENLGKEPGPTSLEIFGAKLKRAATLSKWIVEDQTRRARQTFPKIFRSLRESLDDLKSRMLIGDPSRPGPLEPRGALAISDSIGRMIERFLTRSVERKDAREEWAAAHKERESAGKGSLIGIKMGSQVTFDTDRREGHLPSTFSLQQNSNVMTLHSPNGVNSHLASSSAVNPPAGAVVPYPARAVAFAGCAAAIAN